MDQNENPQLSKEDKKLVRMMRRQSDHSELDTQFSAALKQKLKQQFNEKQAEVSVPAVVQRKVPMALYALLASFVMAVPVLLAILITLNSQGTITQNVSVTPAVDNGEDEVQTSDVQTLRAEFGTLINARDFETMQDYLADEVEISVSGTECCGTLLRIDAADELNFQLDGKGQYDFGDSTKELQLISAQNPDLKDYRFGINDDDFVIGFALNEKFEVDRILFARYETLVNPDSAMRISAIWDQINAFDRAALTSSFAVEVEYIELDKDCCGIISRSETISKLFELAETGRNYKAQDEVAAELEQVIAAYPELETFVLALGTDGSVIGLSLNDDGVVQTVLVLVEQAEKSLATCTQISSAIGQEGSVNFFTPANPTTLSGGWEARYTTFGDDTSGNSTHMFTIIDNLLTAIDGTDGSIDWSVKGIPFFDAHIRADEELIAVVENESMYVFGTEEQSFLWGRSTSFGGSFASVKPVFACGLVIIPSSSETVGSYTLNAIARDGSGRIWSQQLQGEVITQPVYDQTSNLIYLADTSKNLYAINAADGSIVWRSRLNKLAGAMTVHAGRLFVGDGETILSLDALNGNQNYNLPTSSVIAELAVNGDRLIVRMENGGMLSLMQSDGSDVQPTAYTNSSEYLSVGDKVTMVSADGTVFLTDASNLGLLKEFDVRGGTVRPSHMIGDLLVISIGDRYYGLTVR